jgi:hypothetical protein
MQTIIEKNMYKRFYIFFVGVLHSSPRNSDPDSNPFEMLYPISAMRICIYLLNSVGPVLFWPWDPVACIFCEEKFYVLRQLCNGIIVIFYFV